MQIIYVYTLSCNDFFLIDRARAKIPIEMFFFSFSRFVRFVRKVVKSYLLPNESIFRVVVSISLLYFVSRFIGFGIGCGEIVQIYVRILRVRMGVIVLESWLARGCHCRRCCARAFQRRGRGRTVPWYPCVRLRTSCATVSRR